MKLTKNAVIKNRVIANLIWNHQRVPLPLVNNLRGRSCIKYGMPSLYNSYSGFTLIELLVVVLIIGILAAVAVPQYQVAVKKADLARYMSLVAAMREAQDLYYLANGEYTYQIEDLDIGMPIDASCTLESGGQYYDCGNVRMGILNMCNVQAGDNTIRYVQFFAPAREGYAGKVPDRGRVCQARGEIAIKVCQTLGGEEIEVSNGWDKIFVLK